MNKNSGVISHKRFVNNGINELVKQIKADETEGIKIMDSGVLNDSIRGYALYAVNACNRLDKEQRESVMQELKLAIEDCTAEEAKEYYLNNDTKG